MKKKLLAFLVITAIMCQMFSLFVFVSAEDIEEQSVLPDGYVFMEDFNNEQHFLRCLDHSLFAQHKVQRIIRQ